MGDWTFFSNYGHVLVCLARDSRARLRDVAREVGITERAVQKIVKDMQTEGFIEVRKQGRCNRYRINRRKVLRHPLESHCTVGKLLALIAERGSSVEAAGLAEESEVTKEPVVEAIAAAKTEAAPKPPAGGRPEPKAESTREARKKSKPAPEKAPIDVEQQGSLF